MTHSLSMLTSVQQLLFQAFAFEEKLPCLIRPHQAKPENAPSMAVFAAAPVLPAEVAQRGQVTALSVEYRILRTAHQG